METEPHFGSFTSFAEEKQFLGDTDALASHLAVPNAPGAGGSGRSWPGDTLPRLAPRAGCAVRVAPGLSARPPGPMGRRCTP